MKLGIDILIIMESIYNMNSLLLFFYYSNLCYRVESEFFRSKLLVHDKNCLLETKIILLKKNL